MIKNEETSEILTLVPPMDFSPSPLKVSELVKILKQEVEQKHRFVLVVGEISSFKPWRSGHWYFDLKDDQAVIPAVMFKPQAALVKFSVSDGLLVLASCRVSIYEPQSRLQIVIEKLEPLGQGALALAFEQLKTQLFKEGLFDVAFKKPLPLLPRTVGLVTSPQGAALRDMVRILKNRMPKVSIICAPAKVQGLGAKEEIALALQTLDQSGLADVIIVGRGGGSLEDLWAFNEELVARAIFHCQTPVVSAVGHETDTTISDFVADKRCATPTHAAQTVVADEKELKKYLRLQENRLQQLLFARIERDFLTLERFRSRLGEPRLILYRHNQRLDELSQRALKVLQDKLFQWNNFLRILMELLQGCSPLVTLQKKQHLLFSLSKRLHAASPMGQLKEARKKSDILEQTLTHLIGVKMHQAKHRQVMLAEKLEALSPLRVLARGFALVENPQKGLITSMQQVEINASYRMRLADGAFWATVVRIEKQENE